MRFGNEVASMTVAVRRRPRAAQALRKWTVGLIHRAITVAWVTSRKRTLDRRKYGLHPVGVPTGGGLYDAHHR